MVLLILFSISISDIKKSIEKPIFENYNGSVEVTFMVKEGNLVYRQFLYKSGESLKMSKESVALQDVKGTAKLNISKVETTTLFLYTKKVQTLPEAYIVGYILFGDRLGYVNGIEKIHREGYKVIGTNRQGFSVTFDISNRYPLYVKDGSIDIELSGYQRINGVGFIPKVVKIFSDGKEVYERRIESVGYSPIMSEVFKLKKSEKKTLFEEY